MQIRRTHTFLLTVLALLGLAGCSGETGHADLEDFVRQVKAKPGGRIPPLPEFKTYETFAYSAFEYRHPFQSFETSDGPGEVSGKDGLRPDKDRNREALEQFPLDTLKFAGHLEKGGMNWGIITAPDKLVHRVQVGNHLGQNEGRIVGITETNVDIIEIIPDGIGGWVERPAALKLDE